MTKEDECIGITSTYVAFHAIFSLLYYQGLGVFWFWFTAKMQEGFTTSAMHVTKNVTDLECEDGARGNWSP